MKRLSEINKDTLSHPEEIVPGKMYLYSGSRQYGNPIEIVLFLKLNSCNSSYILLYTEEKRRRRILNQVTICGGLKECYYEIPNFLFPKKRK